MCDGRSPTGRERSSELNRNSTREPDDPRGARSQTAELRDPRSRPPRDQHAPRVFALAAATRGKDTLLTGCLSDQAAIYGVIARLESLGLELLEVRRLPS